MSKVETLGEKLTRLRLVRNWSVYAAAQRMPLIGKTTLIRLERGEARPELTPIQTVLSLLHIYYPDIDLPDFIGDRDLRRFIAKRRTKANMKRIANVPRETGG